MLSLLRVFVCVSLLFSVSPIIIAAPTTPDSDFTVNGEGTVLHAITGLTWKRCAEGQVWINNTCTGSATRYNFSQASALSSNFAGNQDWRLPTIAELATIIEREKFNPAINTAIFPNSPLGITVWSNTLPANTISFSNHAWGVDFSFGFMSPLVKNSTSVVRFVRGKPPLNPTQEFTPNNDFIDNSDGTVTHKTTNLTWKRCAEGQTWTGQTCTGKGDIIDLDAAKALKSNFAGHSDWRLPTTNELVSIVEFKRYNPAINTQIFPNTPPFAYTSSNCPANATSKCVYWAVSFIPDADALTRADPYLGSGYVENGQEVPTLDNFVRLVRGKLSAGAISSTNSSDAVSYNENFQLLSLRDLQINTAHYQAVFQYSKTSNAFALKDARIFSGLPYTQPANYDAASLKLSIPRVQVGEKYYKATLKNIDTVNYVFSLESLAETK